MGQKGDEGGRATRKLSFLTALWMNLAFRLLVLAQRVDSLFTDGSRLKAEAGAAISQTNFSAALTICWRFQDALDASVEGDHDGSQGTGFSQFSKKAETLLCFFPVMRY